MNRKHVLFFLSGSIACYKACQVISSLSKAGVEVRCVATDAALKFVGQATLEALSGSPLLSNSLWEKGTALDHISLSKWADLAIVCPATANTINRLAAGMADDLLGCIHLAWPEGKPWWIAPAMNSNMLLHPATQASLKQLANRGARILETDHGPLACGDSGPGRLLAPETITAEILKTLSS